MNTFTSFDGIQIAYRDEGEGPAVILPHGFGVDGLGQFGDFERILPLLERRQEMFREVFGAAPPRADPPQEGRPGVVRALLAAGARTILPDMRGFGASDKPREKTAYADSAMARDVYVRALDLITGKLQWEFKQVGSRAYGAGLLSTAGGLIFAGCDQGIFTALDAKNGTPLWHFNVGQAISASPITYSFKGQYVAVAAGSDVVAFGLFEDDRQSKSAK